METDENMNKMNEKFVEIDENVIKTYIHGKKWAEMWLKL